MDVANPCFPPKSSITLLSQIACEVAIDADSYSAYAMDRATYFTSLRPMKTHQF